MQTNTVALTNQALADEALDTVNGGRGFLDSLAHIGKSTEDGAKMGVDIGIYAGPPGILGGAAAGAYLGAINGMKDVAADVVSSIFR